MSDDEIRALKRKVIGLLDQSHQAHAQGDRGEALRLGAEAAQTDYDLFIVIVAYMKIGQIPNPERDPQGWAEFVAVNG